MSGKFHSGSAPSHVEAGFGECKRTKHCRYSFSSEADKNRHDWTQHLTECTAERKRKSRDANDEKKFVCKKCCLDTRPDYELKKERKSYAN